jgi:hypothetical protein
MSMPGAHRSQLASYQGEKREHEISHIRYSLLGEEIRQPHILYLLSQTILDFNSAESLLPSCLTREISYM